MTNIFANHPLVIVTVCDDHYSPLLAALLKSIELNYKQNQDILVYVISDKIRPKNQKRLEASISSALMTINWIDLEACIPPNAKLPTDRSSYPLNIYARLFIPDILPATLNKALYLDVDMILTADVTELWNTDIESCFLAAVQDQMIKTVSNSWGGILNYREFDLSADTPYFNTGLLLINTKRWRDEHLAQKVLNLISANKQYANYPDQYGLNIVLANKWKKLDKTWNTFASETGSPPSLIHFTSRKPIYKTFRGNPAFRTLFFDYLEKTAWKGLRPIGEFERYLKKISNVLQKYTRLLH
ncbi:glycosyltransferase family 8 protein [Arcticibacter sp. MXS-1]|uniref:glycosyltransferase family 8 protein n=1 Tax=Arcticibacter sp. MXS-1 TaxID=3341726 RepID=UPI0035A93B2C